jgi:hypothetical protein
LLQDQNQEHLVDKLTKSAGFGMGLEFRESANVLSADSQVPVRAGMVFNVSMGEQGSGILLSDGIRAPGVLHKVCCGLSTTIHLRISVSSSILGQNLQCLVQTV